MLLDAIDIEVVAEVASEPLAFTAMTELTVKKAASAPTNLSKAHSDLLQEQNMTQIALVGEITGGNLKPSVLQCYIAQRPTRCIIISHLVEDGQISNSV